VIYIFVLYDNMIYMTVQSLLITTSASQDGD